MNPRKKQSNRLPRFGVWEGVQARRETAAHFTAIGMPVQQHCDSFRFRRAAFYDGLKNKVGLAAAKTAALRINHNIDRCGVGAPPVHSSSRAPRQPPWSQPPHPHTYIHACMYTYIPSITQRPGRTAVFATFLFFCFCFAFNHSALTPLTNFTDHATKLRVLSF